MLVAAMGCSDYQEELDALDYRVTVLEGLVGQVNSELVAIHTVTDVIADGDYITNVTENEEGYILTFNKHGAIQLKHGADGQDAKSPDISVEKADDGNWYWKVNDKWLTDADGNRIRSNGVDGKAVAPQVRISPSGEWEISPDGGTTWNGTGTVAKAQDGADGRTLVASVEVITTISGTFVRFTLTNGVVFDIPMT